MGLDNFFGETKRKKKSKKKVSQQKDKSFNEELEKKDQHIESGMKNEIPEKLDNNTGDQEEKALKISALPKDVSISKIKAETEQKQKVDELKKTIIEDQDKRKEKIVKERQKYESYTPRIWYKDENVENIYQLLKESCENQSRFHFYKKIVKKEILAKNPNIHPEEVAILLEITLGEAYIIMDSILEEKI